jgi:hypothetical protein
MFPSIACWIGNNYLKNAKSTTEMHGKIPQDVL